MKSMMSLLPPSAHFPLGLIFYPEDGGDKFLRNLYILHDATMKTTVPVI
jgi:hypothetical protein